MGRNKVAALIHENREHWAQEEAHEGKSNRGWYKLRNGPNNDFQAFGGKKEKKKDFVTALSYWRLGDKLPLPYCYDGVHKYNPPFTNLT